MGWGIKGRVYREVSAKLLEQTAGVYASCNSRKQQQEPKTAAVIQTLALGDTILTEPSIEAVKKKFPYAKLIVIATAYTRDLFLNNPYVDKLICYNKKMPILEYGSFINLLRKENIDVVFDFQNTFTDWKRTMLPFFSGAKERVGFQRQAYHGFLNTTEVPAPQRKHEIEHYLGLVSESPPETKSKELLLPNIFFGEEEKQWTERFLKTYGIKKTDIVIGLHPCNANPLKRWKPEYFAAVAEHCWKEYNAKILVTGAPAEKQILEEIKEQCNVPCIILNNLSVREFCRIIARCDLLISVDTSAIHIAAATGTPTVALFGPTDPVCWRPANLKNQVMVQTHIACQPCEQTSHKSIKLNGIACPFSRNLCLTELEPARVYSSVNKIMKKQQKNK